MKTSQKIVAIIVVLSIFAAMFYAVYKLVDASNAGLHGGF